MDLEVEVAKLRLLKSEYQSTQYQLEDRLLKRYPEQIKKKEAQIAGIKADQKTAEQHPKSENVFCCSSFYTSGSLSNTVSSFDKFTQSVLENGNV